MSRRALLVLGGLVVAAVAVVIVSSLVAGQLESGPEPGPLRIPGPLGFLFGGFGRGPFGRFGPFGPPLAGWRGVASALGAYCFPFLGRVLPPLAPPPPLPVA